MQKLILMTIIVFSQFVSADIVQNFSVADNPFMRIDENTLSEEINPRRDQGEDFDLTPTGFSWGGYCSDTSYRVEIDQNSHHFGPDVDELIFKPAAAYTNISGSYAYTIFDSAGGSQADQSVNLSLPGAYIQLKISDIWNGWFGGGDNSSGLPSPANEVRATILRAMIRDAEGRWYLSSLFCPSTVQDYSLDGTIFEYQLTLDEVQWYAVESGVNINLNLLTGGDEMPLSCSQTAGLPDLSAVTGGGVYVWSAFDSTNGQLAITEISWVEPYIPEPVITLSEMAVSDYVRPDWAPKHSDVCFSSRWPRGEGYNEAQKWWGTMGTAEEKPFDTIEIMKMYHATRLDWIYVRGQHEIDLLPEIRTEGVTVSAAQTSNLSDDPGGTGYRLEGRLLDIDGNYILDAYSRPRGCVNNHDFRDIFLRELKLRIDFGATSLQVDDPTLNDGEECHCQYCQGTKIGTDATTEFYTWLHEQADAYYFETFGVEKFPIHGNNTSRTRFSPSYFADVENYRLDFGLGENDWKYFSSQHLHNVSVLARTYAGGNRTQIFTAPGKPMEEKDIVWYQALTRRLIGNGYAQGLNPLVPFDRFDCDPPGAGDEAQAGRFFGNPQNYADLYGFVRGIAIYLDDYEIAWDWGRTEKALLSESGTEYGDTWGTPPGTNQPVVSVADDVAVVIRAVPGVNDAPVAVHLIEWGNNESFNITLNNEKFFGDPQDNLRFTLLEPLSNYDAYDYEATWENLNYTHYVQSTVLTGAYSNGNTTITIPPLSPWAVLMVSKDKDSPLPLYDSPRWQMLKDAAPSVAEPVYPLENILVTGVQAIMLEFDKELDPSTVTDENFYVLHEDTATPVHGTWEKVGNVARFKPEQVYPKGTISVQLSPEIKRLNGARCLKQKFFYTCDINSADVNTDQTVDLADVAYIAANWLKFSSQGDANWDGYVNRKDIEVLADNWLMCYAEPVDVISPAPGTENVSDNVLLKWDSDAVSYDVYLGTNFEAVESANILSPEFKTNTIDQTYFAENLEFGQTYYWRIDSIADGCTAHGYVYPFTVLVPGTLGYWELDLSGNSAVGSYLLLAMQGSYMPDSAEYASISNPDGTNPWNSSSSSAHNSSSMYFDGATALVCNTSDSPFQFKRSVPFTCEAYIRPTSENPGTAIIFGTRDSFSEWNGWNLRYSPETRQLIFYMVHPEGTITLNSSSNAVPINEFSHTALVWDPSIGDDGRITVYLNGEIVIQSPGGSHWNDEPVCGWNFMVGGRNLADNEWGFTGQIDEIRWSYSSLEPSQFLNAAQ
jgi:hypothetical protein